MAAVAIVAALPAELSPLVQTWERLPQVLGVSAWRTSYGGRECVAVCGGMGAMPATRALARAREIIQPAMVMSVGWAGALGPELAVGAVVRPEGVLDARTGERFGIERAASLLVTLGHIAGGAEKARLREAYAGAVAVDMEAATLARLSAAAGVAFRAIKAISDDATARLPDLNPFLTANGGFRTARFVAHVGRRPRYWTSVMRLGRHAKLAAECLARAIEQDLQGEEPQ